MPKKHLDAALSSAKSSTLLVKLSDKLYRFRIMMDIEQILVELQLEQRSMTNFHH